MGHGSKSYLSVKDGKIHRRVDLIEPFTEIEWFFKKPKLFFIQACAVKENRKRYSSCEWFPSLFNFQVCLILTPLFLALCWVGVIDYPSVYLVGAFLSFLALHFTHAASGGDLKALSAQTDSVSWKAAAGDSWQEKYADYTDVSNINCFADTLISYATMWYQAAARNEKGE